MLSLIPNVHPLSLDYIKQHQNKGIADNITQSLASCRGRVDWYSGSWYLPKLLVES